MNRRRLVGVALAAVVALGSGAASAQRYTSDALTQIAVEARPIESFDLRDPSRVRFGALEFRGGIALTSKYFAFGGISAIRLADDGAHFTAVTDRGSWLRGRIVYDGNGRPTGIGDAQMAPILGADGKSLAARGWYDTEALAADGSNFYVGIERVEQIVRFAAKDGLAARGQPLPAPPDFKTLTRNLSLECLDSIPRSLPRGGSLLTVAERSLDAQGNLRGFLLAGADVTRFSVKRSDDYDVSDCAILPPRDFLLLERRFSVARGVAIRIRRLQLSEIKPNATLDGPALLEADMGFEIDNMEGLAVHKNARGETILTLVSDDNFSPLQRTLLLQFAVVGER